MSDTTMLHVRIDVETKEKAAETLAQMGLTVSDAVRLLMHRVARDQAFPLELKVPNAETQAAMIEARSMAQARFKNVQELFNGLER